MPYTLYHGCTASAYPLIVKGQFGLAKKGEEIVHPWTCADGSDIFFYDKKLFRESEGWENEDDEFVIPEVIRRCNEQAQIQNACLKTPLEKTVVLECTFHTDKDGYEINSWEDIAHPDDSCDNMNAAVCMDAKYFRSLVKAGKVTFKVHEFPFHPKLALFYIAGIAVENNQFNLDYFSSTEFDFCRKLMNLDFYLDELIDIGESSCYEITTTKINGNTYYFRHYQ